MLAANTKQALLLLHPLLLLFLRFLLRLYLRFLLQPTAATPAATLLLLPPTIR
jgi:hypothetical protein